MDYIGGIISAFAPNTASDDPLSPAPTRYGEARDEGARVAGPILGWIGAGAAMIGLIITVIALTLLSQIAPFASSDTPVTRDESSNVTPDDEIPPIAAQPVDTAAASPQGDQEANAAPAPPPIKHMEMKVARGDTLMELLIKAGAKRIDAYNAIESMKAVFNPRRIRAGQVVQVSFLQQEAIKEDPIFLDGSGEPAVKSEDNGEPQFVGLALQPDPVKTVSVSRAEDGAFVSNETIKELTERYARGQGVIESSLYVAAVEAEIPHGIIVELIRMYSYDIDFQREIRKGDEFEVFYSRFYDEEGNALKEGDVLYGLMTVRGKRKDLYRFTPSDDKITDYFDASGKSAKQFLMRTPIEGARISSSFGRRRHPVLGYTKMHKGTDFAAPRGTPVMAAGNGVIARSSRFGSYGKYIRVRHANGYETAYAHLNGYARGIRKNKRVSQGQIIGYVGTTGRSTGPHLHYEVHYNRKQVNPMKVRIPSGRTLKGDIFADFGAHRDEIRTLMATTPPAGPVATAELEADVSPVPTATP
jgi:murein DD-endopeptidase MepM/ murein hydrolase activator NlpD